jgi:hypothetical protein
MGASAQPDLTVLVPASPIPSHPSTAVVARALDSFLLNLPDGSFRTVICHDPPSPSATAATVRAFSRYLRRLERVATADRYRRLGVEVTVAPHWGHLAGSLRHVIALVRTEFVLVFQHDFFLTEPLPVLELVAMMRRHPEVKHLRLNRKTNLPRFWDGRTEERRDFFAERTFAGVTVCRTLAWSDNPHLARTDYYTDLVLPLVGERPTFPEDVCDPLNTAASHAQFGTFIYGGVGRPATVGHLDGATYVPPSRSQRVVTAIRARLRIRSRVRALLRR